MRQTTTEEKIQNILIARAMLDDIPNERLVNGLCAWKEDASVGFDYNPHTCGSAMCFGGWIAVHPYFREKYGIRAAREGLETSYGQPRTRYETDTAVISKQLFGVDNAFHTNETRYGVNMRSDRTVIKDRLRNALNKLVKEL